MGWKYRSARHLIHELANYFYLLYTWLHVSIRIFSPSVNLFPEGEWSYRLLLNTMHWHTLVQLICIYGFLIIMHGLHWSSMLYLLPTFAEVLRPFASAIQRTLCRRSSLSNSFARERHSTTSKYIHIQTSHSPLTHTHK